MGGQNDVAMLFRSSAEGETGHAHGHLEFLEHGCGDPATGLPIGGSRQNLAAAVAGETHAYTDMYPGMAKTAGDEGFDEIADCFMREGKREAPTLHALDWRKPEFYDEASAYREMERVFDICHRGRRCVSLCQRFPNLFDLADATEDGEVHGVKKKACWRVVAPC
jgi:rubrerythrin